MSFFSFKMFVAYKFGHNLQRMKKEGANTEEIETTTTIGVLVEKLNDKTIFNESGEEHDRRFNNESIIQ